MKMFRFKEVYEGVESVLDGELDSPDLELCFDSRKASERSLFWPLIGVSFDAHSFVNELIKQGVKYFVVGASWYESNKSLKANFVVVKDVNIALGEFANSYSKKMKSHRVALTGSNGKTTCKEMMHSLLGRKQVAATKGNLNNHIGVPFTLLNVKPTDRFSIVEAGTNHPGEIAYLSKVIEPNSVFFTNIGDSHIEFFKNRKGVYTEKITLLNNLSNGGLVVYPAEDPFFKKMNKEKTFKYISYGVKEGDFSPKNLTWNEKSCAKFELDNVKFELNIPGEHNLRNALGVIAMCTEQGESLVDLSDRLKQFSGSNMRTEIVEKNGVLWVLDCYNANPSSMKEALVLTMKLPAEKRKIAILGEMGELGEMSGDFHEKMIPYIEKNYFAKVYLIGKEMLQISEKVSRFVNVKCVENSIEILPDLEEYLLAGDQVLVKGSRSTKLDLIIEKFIKGNS